MKAKKFAALFLTCAVAVTAASLLAACDDKKEEEKPQFVEDTRVWYAVGNDKKGTAKVNGWQPQTINNEMKFTRDTTVQNENVFTLSLDIYAGDKSAGYGFKFLYKTSDTETITTDDLWTRQIGIHQFVGVEGEAEAAVLKDGTTTVFTTDSGANANNLYLAKGQEGKYKFILKTYPDGNGGDTKDPVLSYTKVESIAVTHDMWVYGDLNNFGWGSTSDKYPMNEVIADDNVTWSTQIEVTDSDLKRDETGAKVAEGGQYAAVQLYNRIKANNKNATFTAPTADYKVVEITQDEVTSEYNLLPKGKYSITYDQKTNAVTVIAGTHEMYFRGSGAGMSWDKCLADYKLTETSANVWTGTLALKANDQVKFFNKLESNGWYGLPAEVTPTEDDIYTTNNDRNIIVKEDGIYTFTFNAETNAVTCAKVDVCIVGTFINAQDELKNFEYVEGLTPKFTPSSESATVITCELVVVDASGKTNNFAGWGAPEGAKFAWKPVFYINNALDWSKTSQANNYVNEVGTYTVTYNIVTQAITINK